MEYAMNEKSSQFTLGQAILVLGANGKTGRRVASRLKGGGQSIRVGSRKGTPPFDWIQKKTWEEALRGVNAVYVNYPSDLPVLGSAEIISAFVDQAADLGVRHLVLLSGRGEPECLEWEKYVKASGLDWTIIRSSWFQQNFSEGGFAEMVQAGEIVLPAGNIPEAFIDIDDLAEVVVAALTQPGHTGTIYELTGPRLLTFAETAAELSKATGRSIEYQQIPHDAFLAALTDAGVPDGAVWLMDYLFATILDGRNAYLTDDVETVLGRPPKDFSEFAREVALTNTWRQAA